METCCIGGTRRQICEYDRGSLGVLVFFGSKQNYFIAHRIRGDRASRSALEIELAIANHWHVGHAQSAESAGDIVAEIIDRRRDGATGRGGIRNRNSDWL